MPTLDEMRRWLNGESIPGMPEPFGTKEQRRLDLARMQDKRGGGKWRYTKIPGRDGVTGSDAIIHFGKFAGAKVSTIVGVEDGRSWLEWVRKQPGVPAELVRIIVNVVRQVNG